MDRETAAEQFRRWSVVIYGCVLLLGSVGHLAIARDILLSVYFEVAVPAAISTGVVFLGWSMVRQGLTGEDIGTVFWWCLGGGISMVLVTTWLVLFQLADGVPMSDTVSVGASGIAVGSVVGGMLGSHEIRLHRRTEQLLEQNNRLESFGAIVAHDLRNPLNIAQGHLELLREDTDCKEEYQQIEHALGRMERILDQVLFVAHEGPTVWSNDVLSLATVARTSWADLDTGDATLRVTTDRQIEADEHRLHVLFEHLYRNAVEHGSTSGSVPDSTSPEDGTSDLTIVVGDLDAGFFVEDNGEGVQPDLRERVFEGGYTTSETGHGFGLSIVRTISDAHGWNHRLTAGDDGGTRVEFSSVAVLGD
jgi:signal transduction histidine kinase